MSEMPARLLEWEKNLQRCITEGREPPNDEYKRLALLRMIPQKQRASIWETANKLYPTFAELLAKVQEMVQDDLDHKNGVSPMDIDNAEPEGEWVNTGQTLTGKGANGEDTIFLLQRRGSAMRVTPKGKGKGAGKGGGGGAQDQGPGGEPK